MSDETDETHEIIFQEARSEADGRRAIIIGDIDGDGQRDHIQVNQLLYEESLHILFNDEMLAYDLREESGGVEGTVRYSPEMDGDKPYVTLPVAEGRFVGGSDGSVNNYEAIAERLLENPHVVDAVNRLMTRIQADNGSVPVVRQLMEDRSAVLGR